MMDAHDESALPFLECLETLSRALDMYIDLLEGIGNTPSQPLFDWVVQQRDFLETIYVFLFKNIQNSNPYSEGEYLNSAIVQKMADIGIDQTWRDIDKKLADALDSQNISVFDRDGIEGLRHKFTTLSYQVLQNIRVLEDAIGSISKPSENKDMDILSIAIHGQKNDTVAALNGTKKSIHELKPQIQGGSLWPYKSCTLT